MMLSRAPRLDTAVKAVSAERMVRRVSELASIGATSDGGVSRLGLTVEERAARDLVTSWLSPLGFRCRTDDACNLFCSIGDTPRLLIGSHLDSVPSGGRYDGALGVVAAAELAEAAHVGGLELPLEVVAWSAEEGARYRPGHFGSSAAFGQLPPDAWDRPLADGATVTEAIRGVLGRHPSPSSCRRSTTEFVAYLELHIEQGPRLAEADVPVGVVTDIVGMTRGQIVLNGRADHAGTTPMQLRSDALAAAAECVLIVERVAREANDHLVGTVGELRVFPGAANVVPGMCRLSIELRSRRDLARRTAFDAILELLQSMCERRGVRWEVEVADEVAATPLSEAVIGVIEASCARLGLPATRIPSGAGHDAQNVMIAGVPSGMVFVRSRGGSHNPSESASADDIAAGTRAMLAAATAIARGCWTSR